MATFITVDSMLAIRFIKNSDINLVRLILKPDRQMSL